MKIIKSVRNALALAMIFFVGSVHAFEVGGARHDCRDPKFKTFSPPERVKKEPIPEVDPESEISFTVSGNASPESIRVTAKKQKLEAKILDKMSFYQVSAKLPAAFNGKFVRINMWATDKDGKCTGKDGWLIKVKSAPEEVKVEATDE